VRVPCHVDRGRGLTAVVAVVVVGVRIFRGRTGEAGTRTRVEGPAYAWCWAGGASWACESAVGCTSTGVMTMTTIGNMTVGGLGGQWAKMPMPRSQGTAVMPS
jgi:hypothetical protein